MEINYPNEKINEKCQCRTLLLKKTKVRKTGSCGFCLVRWGFTDKIFPIYYTTITTVLDLFAVGSSRSFTLINLECGGNY